MVEPQAAFGEAGKNQRHESVIECEIGYPGLVMGRAYILSEDYLQEPQNPEDPSDVNVTAETERFATALKNIEKTYAEHQDEAEKLPVEFNDEVKEMLEVELMMISSPDFSPAVEDLISEGKTAPVAVYSYLQSKIEGLGKPNNDLVRKLKESYKQITISFGKEFCPKAHGNNISDVPDGYIPVASSIPVANMSQFRNDQGTRIWGAITSEGSNADHTNVIARAAKITMARIPKERLTRLDNEDFIIIDGPGEQIIVNPAPETRRTYELQLEARQDNSRHILERSQEEIHPKTRDGVLIDICANIGFSDEVHTVRDVNAPAVGLYRTEFAVLSRLKNPTRAKWEDIFKHIAAQAEARPVTIRTVDFFGDKDDEKITSLSQERQIDMARDQIAAALAVQKGSPTADFKIMIPMVRGVEKFAPFQKIMKEEAEKLDVKPIPLGAMVEVPAIADPEELIELDADFYSIGTKDLIPSFLNYNRYDPRQEGEYEPSSRKVLKKLKQILEVQNNYGDHGLNKPIPVSLCGNMASEPYNFALLVGCGFTNISAGAANVPMIKELARRINTREAQSLVDRLQHTEIRAEREALLDYFNEERLGIHMDGTLEADFTPPTQAFDFEKALQDIRCNEFAKPRYGYDTPAADGQT